MSRPDEWQNRETRVLNQGWPDGPHAYQEREYGSDPAIYQPPGRPEAGSWLHIFDPWAHFLLRPWNPARRRESMDHLAAQVGVNAVLVSLAAAGWVTTGAIRTGLLAGAGFAAFVVVSGWLMRFVAGELGAPGLSQRLLAVAVDASCALVLMLLAFRFGHPIPGLILVVLYFVALVKGVQQWSGFSRLRALGTVYLAFEVGVVGSAAVALGAILALHA